MCLKNDCSARLIILILVGFNLLITFQSKAQNRQLDSLKIAVRNLSGVEKVEALNIVVAESWNYSFEEALKYAQQANSLSREIKYTKGIVRSLSDIGLYYFFTGDYNLARKFFNQALDMLGDQKFSVFPGITLNFLGNLYRDESKFDSAMIYYNKSLEEFGNGEERFKNWGYSIVFYNRAELSYSLLHLDEGVDNTQSALNFSEQQNDSIRIGFCWSLLGSIHSWKYEIDSAEAYFEKLSGLVKHSNNNHLKFLYYLRRGDLEFRKNNHGEAILHYTQALEHLKWNDYKRYHPEILMKIGQIFQLQGDFNRALEHFINALEINKELGNIVGQAKVNVLIGSLHLNEENDALALDFGREALRQAQSVRDEAGISAAYNLLGKVASKQMDYTGANEYFSKALQIRRSLKLIGEINSTLFNMSQVYTKQKQLKKAIEILQPILSAGQDGVDKQLLVSSYNALAGIYIQQGNYQLALSNLKAGQQLSNKLKLPIELRDSYRLEAELYQETGEFKRAVDSYKRYTMLNDSLFNSESLAKVAQLNAVYQLSNREREIRLLNEQNEKKENQIFSQREQLHFQRNIMFVSIVGLLFLSILVYVLYIYYKQKNRAHQILTGFHREITEKNEEIQAQSEELIEANETLTELNNDLLASREEVDAKSAELAIANETISEINKDLEQKVQLRTDQLRQAYVELDTFFYRSSHDFRRPLTTFLGLAEVAKITVRDVNALELFEKVQETALNLDKMLVKLQSISDVGAHQLVYKEVFLKELLLEISDTFRSELGKRKISYSLDYQLQGRFISYAALVRIIIENLLENAINFCRQDNPYIKVYAVEEYGSIVLSIEDNGQGISEALSDRIFDMYFRANHNSTGNGLGLYIVKKAVEKLGGEITFRSELNSGSCFTVRLPLE